MKEDTKEFLKAIAWLYLGFVPIGVAVYALIQWNLLEAAFLFVLGFWFYVKEVEPRTKLLRGKYD